MNNPIIVTDRVLSYYDSKLKGYIGSFYGCDMIVEWEPMENGKNYFKLKIALKNKHGAELFSKIIDFPLEQTIVSGEYNNKDKSLILYFQDGSYTSIPIEDLIEGLASKLDLEKKADLGENQVVIGNDYSVEVPTRSAPYAQINKIGGMSYKDGNTLRDAKVTEVKSVGANLIPYPYDLSSGMYNGVTITFNNDGSFTFNGAATSASYLLLKSVTLPAGTYYVSDNGNNDWKGRFYASLSTGNYFKNSSFTLTEPTLVDFRLAIYESFIGTATFYPMVNRGTEALPFAPYTEHTLAIPESVQSLEGYGQSNPDNAEEYNYIDLKNQKFISFGYISNSVWVSRYSTTDIDISSIMGVEGNGTITFENEYGYNVPYEIEYTINSNDVIGAEEFVGNLKGTAEVAKYYDDNGNPSTQTIGEALNKLLDAGNPLKITTESIGQLSASQVIAGISVNIISNPPVAINDIILDRYHEGDASYLCFWLVTNISGGSTDSTMTLQGAGNIYVGGGSASVADRAISDGNGNNIVSTYETKAQVKAITDEIKSTANSAYERATVAINTAQDSLNRVNRGVYSIDADYTSGAGSIGTFYLRVNFVGGGSESYNITEAMRGLINDVLTYDR